MYILSIFKPTVLCISKYFNPAQIENISKSEEQWKEKDRRSSSKRNICLNYSLCSGPGNISAILETSSENIEIYNARNLGRKQRECLWFFFYTENSEVSRMFMFSLRKIIMFCDLIKFKRICC